MPMIRPGTWVALDAKADKETDSLLDRNVASGQSMET